MKFSAVSFIAGIIFGCGLLVGEMTRPDRVIGFLNIFGEWDPTLIFVMGGAVTVHMHMLMLQFILKRNKPVLGKKFDIPDKKEITPSLIIGSTLFGIGWGLGGYCPVPGITAIASANIRPIVFVICMVIGMWGYRLFQRN